MTISIDFLGGNKNYSLKRVKGDIPIFYKKGTHNVIKSYDNLSCLPDLTVPDSYTIVGKPFYDAVADKTVCMYENVEDVFAMRTVNDFGQKIKKVL